MSLALCQTAAALPSLADCYQGPGPLAPFTPPLIGTEIPVGAIKAARWRNPALLEQDISSYASRYPGGDKRAITSLWSKWHFVALTVPTLASQLLLNRDLPVGLDEVYVIVNEQGCTKQLWLPDEGVSLDTQDPSKRFAKLIDQHWAPLIERLAAISGAAPRVFWSNAGGYLDFYVNALAEHPAVNQEALTAARALLESRHLHGQRNPLFQPVRTFTPKGSDEVKQVRKLCCLRYLLDEFSVCSNCPLEGCDRVARKRST